MDLFTLQLIFATSIFVCMFFCMILPSLVISGNVRLFRDRTLSCFNCLAGGVFVGMCFLGLIPDLHHRFKEVTEELNPKIINFPFSEFTIIMGFFLTLFSEQYFLGKLAKKEMTAGSPGESAEVPMFAINDSDEQCNGVKSSEEPKEHGGHHSHTVTDAMERKGLKMIILLVAVSVHSLFEGLALGLQTDNVKVLNLFIAIILHEALVSIAIGMNIAKKRTGVCVALPFIFVLSMMIPIGIFVGYFIKSAPGLAGSITSCILQGFAAGVFIYVAFIEVIPTELDLQDHNLLKTSFVFIGFLIVSVLNLFLHIKD